ncbi:MAG: beta-galactosidase [Roseiflexaceae bacterium]
MATLQRTPPLAPKVPRLIYGGDYNPEQWPESVWEEDARLMQEAGVNLVSLAIFSWTRLEPRPGEFDFSWLDRVIDLLYAHGVSVNLATATAAPPPWMAIQHPDILPVTMEGVTLWHGSRRHYSPHSSTYREAAKRLVRKLAERYGAHPALAMWHVDNEYACHYCEDFSDAAAANFRTWLQARYGSLDTLNARWGSAFWGQIYSAWEEIIPPRSAPAMVNPGHQLDWKRFCSDAWLACYEDQRAILKELTPDIPVTTNFMGFFQPLDYWKWAARGDLVANDAYPEPSDPSSVIDSAMACDLMRSLGGGRSWVLMEQATGQVNWRQRNPTKRPGQMRATSYQALSRGADGIMFFQWRASQGGGEQFHSGMVPHGGTNTRVWREVKALGTELGQLSALRGGVVPAQVAIIFDWDAWWALELGGKPSGDLHYLEMVRRYYQPLYERNIAVDFVRPDADLSGYKLVFAPCLYLTTDAAAAAISRYVAEGGTLVMSFFSGIIDEHGQVRLGGYPAQFRSLLGLRVEEFAPYGAGQGGSVYTFDEESYATDLWSDVIDLEGAEVLASHANEYYANKAAITRNAHGRGAAYYVGTRLDDAGMNWLINLLCTQTGVNGLAAPAGVELIERVVDGTTYLFAINQTTEATTVTLNGAWRDLLAGGTHQRLQLPAYGVAVLVQ